MMGMGQYGASKVLVIFYFLTLVVGILKQCTIFLYIFFCIYTMFHNTQYLKKRVKCGPVLAERKSMYIKIDNNKGRNNKDPRENKNSECSGIQRQGRH